MNARLALIRRRRQLLRLGAETQRQTLAGIGERWRAPLALVEIGIAAASGLRRHPWILGGSIALLARSSRPRVRQWMGMAVAIWQGCRMLASAGRRRGAR